MFTTDPFRKIKIKIYLLQIYKNQSRTFLEKLQFQASCFLMLVS